MISAVRQAHLKCWNSPKSEKQQTAKEAKQRKVAEWNKLQRPLRIPERRQKNITSFSRL